MSLSTLYPKMDRFYFGNKFHFWCFYVWFNYILMFIWNLIVGSTAKGKISKFSVLKSKFYVSILEFDIDASTPVPCNLNPGNFLFSSVLKKEKFFGTVFIMFQFSRTNLASFFFTCWVQNVSEITKISWKTNIFLLDRKYTLIF